MASPPAPELSLVTQRVRLTVIDCLKGISDETASDEAVNTCLEFLVEDFCDLHTPDDSFGSSLDAMLVDGSEREAARDALPKILRIYMDWDYAKPHTAPRNRPDIEFVRAAVRQLLDCMLRNAPAQADAMRERQEGAQ